MENVGEELRECGRLRTLRRDGEIEARELEPAAVGCFGVLPGRVVLLPTRRVGERLVRFRNALEQGLSCRVPRIDSGMMPARKPAVRPLDFDVAGSRLDAQH